MTDDKRIDRLIDQFPSLTLEEMKSVRLMRRVDTKYVATKETLHILLEECLPFYQIQQNGENRKMNYHTLYFDTHDAIMFYEHHRGKKNRYKIRVREYVGEEKDNIFLEVKHKNNHGATSKKRILIGSEIEAPSHDDFITLHAPYSFDNLERKIENRFNRLTLVNHDMTERITIDINIMFNNLVTDKRVIIPDLTVIEWKREMSNSQSPLPIILRNLRIRPSGFSKYCVGMAVTDSNLRQNRLKSRFRTIQKINSGKSPFLCAI